MDTPSNTSLESQLSKSSKTPQNAPRTPEDGRGIAYSEYHPKKNLDAIPRIWSKGVDAILSKFEKDSWIPHTLPDVLNLLNALIQAELKYDAMTYLLAENIDTRDDSYTARIDPTRIGMTPSQIRLFIEELVALERRIRAKIDPDEAPTWENLSSYLKNLIHSMKSTKNADEAYARIVQELWYEWRYSLSLSRHLSSDSRYGKAHAQTYSKHVFEILRDQAVQCHALSALSKTIIESWNSRWKLWVHSIQYLESPSQDHTILEIVMKSGEKIIYDPTRNFLIKSPKEK